MRHTFFAGIGTTLLFLSFVFLSCELGDQPLGPSTSEVDGTTNDTLPVAVDSISEGKTEGLEIVVGSTKLPASKTATTNVRVWAIDSDSRTPLANTVVHFKATHGRLSTKSDTTDAEGLATAIFTSTQENAEASIVAWTLINDSLVAVKKSITIAGVKVTIQPDTADVLTGTNIPVTVTVVDAYNVPVSYEPVTLSINAATSVDTTLGDGTVSTSITRSTYGNVAVAATAAGAAETASYNFWTQLPSDAVTYDSVTNEMEIYITPSTLRATESDKATVKVRLFDDNHNPRVGQEVRFSTTLGIISPATSTSDNSGHAYATLTAVPLNAEGTVTAQITANDSTYRVRQNITIKGLEINVSAKNNALVGEQVPVSVTVVDAGGQPVASKVITLSGAITATVQTKGDGSFDTTVTSSLQDTLTVVAAGLGAKDSTMIAFWVGSIPAGVVDSVEKIRQMRIFSSKSQLKADNTDKATITVILVDENNNPASGDQVTFTASHGVIDKSATVDETGRATVTLQSTPVNTICEVTATAVGRNIWESTRIPISGISVSLTADPKSLTVDRYATVEALVVDASGNPVGEDTISFSIGTGGVVDGPTKLVLNPQGKASILMTASIAGAVSVRASALGASDSTSVTFSRNTLLVSASPAKISVGGVDTTLITATYTDSAGVALPNQLIYFATNAGEILDDTATTVANGTAVTTLRSSEFATTATVVAWARDSATAETDVEFVATSPAGVTLQITPDNIGVNGGTATLIATVRDSKGNVASGAEVNFKILKGPGGNEHITKPVVTSENGVARSELRAGSLPSAYRGCEIGVCVGGAICDTSKLTISGEPYVITVSVPEKDTIEVPEGGLRNESIFQMFVGAVVQDINGNPVADGTEVHFSAVVSGMSVGRLRFIKWEPTLSGIVPVVGWTNMDVVFEDINNNYKMDPGIDLTLDYNDAVAGRGDDVNGDGVVDYDPSTHDFFWDFNLNGICDSGGLSMLDDDYSGEPYYVDYSTTPPTEHPEIFADLNKNGRLDRKELAVDWNGNNQCDLPASGDFRFSKWELRDFWDNDRFDFNRNDFAVTIDASVVTQDGVADALLTYPRQMARKLYVTVNAEANGIRDRNGERFILKIIR